MLYVVIIAVIGVLAFPFYADYQNPNWDAGSIFAFVCILVSVVGVSLLYITNDEFDEFEEQVISTSITEKKKLIFPLDMSAQKSGKYFIISRKDGAYHLYVKTETGFEQTEYDIDATDLKQCNEKYPEACVVETVMTTVHQYIPRYKKFLYYGVVFLCSANKPEETEEITTYTLYVPQNTIVQ